MGRRRSFSAMLTCTAGLEGVVSRELKQRIGVSATVPRSGRLHASMSTRQLYASNVFLRTADRILIRAATFHAASMWELELAIKRLKAAELQDWICRDAPVVVRCEVSQCALYHGSAIAQRVRNHLQAVDGASDESGSQLVSLIGHRDLFQLWVDATGAPLHQRGWNSFGGPNLLSHHAH